MVDLVITAASVKSQGGTVEHGVAGATITAGKLLAVAADSRYVLADSNGAAPINMPRGIALHGSSADQPIAVHRSGPIALGTTLVAGAPYYMSETPGGIQPIADLQTGETIAQIGLATSTTTLDFRVTAPGVVA